MSDVFQILTHQAVEKLIKVIQELDKKNSNLSNKMYWLIVVALILAGTQIIPAIDILLKWFGKNP